MKFFQDILPKLGGWFALSLLVLVILSPVLGKEIKSGVEQTNIVTETKFIPVGQLFADGTTDPAAAATEDNMQYRDFDSSSDEDLEYLWQVPQDLYGSTIKVRPLIVCSGVTPPADGEGVSWGIAAASSGTNDSHDPSLGTEVNSEDADLDDDCGAQWDIIYFPWVEVTPTSLTAGESCAIRIDRDTSDTTDDYGQDIGLMGIEIAYRRTNATSYPGL